ncbi:MAG: 2'-deoxycytidine 5'-triphosphate deaminase [Planctomycetes bacterium]|nr:2'-deoxycytidine 5'-triphosphate deaminase [Planctomycetota bacterium]
MSDTAQSFNALSGALTTALIRELVARGHVLSTAGIADRQYQPASLDLTLAEEGYKLPGSILPLRNEKVRDVIADFRARPLDLGQPCYLDRGGVYLIRLNEALDLPPGIGAYTNNKSSTGRIDLQTRTLSDGNPRYEKHSRGYRGELWIEVIPKSFDVRVRAGVSLNQAIFYGQRAILGDAELEGLMAKTPLLFDKEGRAIGPGEAVVDQGLLMAIDLDQEVVGYVAKKSPDPIILDVDEKADPRDFFDPIERPRHQRLLLMKEHFYILSTLEYVRVPTEYAVEMLPFETTAGEFRAHYAGFFDPGFGWGRSGEVKGTPAVLEVRPYDDDLVLRHGQPICKMAYERLCGSTDRIYGEGPVNHYAHQRGPRLSRYFG